MPDPNVFIFSRTAMSLHLATTRPGISIDQLALTQSSNLLIVCEQGVITTVSCSDILPIEH